MTEARADLLRHPITDEFARTTLAGLAQPSKTTAARYFYDERGSALFEEICGVPEYYPCRTELGILHRHAADIAHLTGMGRAVVEFGAGSATKTPILLRATGATVYVPIDISGDFLSEQMRELATAMPTLDILPVAADFTQNLALPSLDGPLTGFFPGSTIGNFGHAAAVDLLRSFRRILGAGAHLVIGIDTRKDPRMLEAAYDDAAGVTAQFNLNVLERINRELEGTIDVDAFEHRAVWHDGLGRMEMHLVATRDLSFTVAGRRFSMGRGETIHTENSYKYTPREARLLARAAGWEPLACWQDADELFGVHVWKACPETIHP